MKFAESSRILRGVTVVFLLSRCFKKWDFWCFHRLAPVPVSDKFLWYTFSQEHKKAFVGKIELFGFKPHCQNKKGTKKLHVFVNYVSLMHFYTVLKKDVFFLHFVKQHLELSQNVFCGLRGVKPIGFTHPYRNVQNLKFRVFFQHKKSSLWTSEI